MLRSSISINISDHRLTQTTAMSCMPEQQNNNTQQQHVRIMRVNTNKTYTESRDAMMMMLGKTSLVCCSRVLPVHALARAGERGGASRRAKIVCLLCSLVGATRSSFYYRLAAVSLSRYLVIYLVYTYIPGIL